MECYTTDVETSLEQKVLYEDRHKRLIKSLPQIAKATNVPTKFILTTAGIFIKPHETHFLRDLRKIRKAYSGAILIIEDASLNIKTGEYTPLHKMSVYGGNIIRNGMTPRLESVSSILHTRAYDLDYYVDASLLLLYDFSAVTTCSEQNKEKLVGVLSRRSDKFTLVSMTQSEYEQILKLTPEVAVLLGNYHRI